MSCIGNSHNNKISENWHFSPKMLDLEFSQFLKIIYWEMFKKIVILHILSNYQLNFYKFLDIKKIILNSYVKKHIIIVTQNWFYKLPHNGLVGIPPNWFKGKLFFFLGVFFFNIEDGK